MKYIRTTEGFTVWPENTSVWHSHQDSMATARTVSAGFVHFYASENRFICGGKSESLGMSSLPEDTELFNKWIKEN